MWKVHSGVVVVTSVTPGAKGRAAGLKYGERENGEGSPLHILSIPASDFHWSGNSLTSCLFFCHRNKQDWHILTSAKFLTSNN